MSFKPVFMLWISVDVRERHRIRFAVPLSTFGMAVLLDILADFLELYRLFCPASARKEVEERTKRYLPAGLDGAADLLYTVFSELMLHTGPTELICVDVTRPDGYVRVRCALR